MLHDTITKQIPQLARGQVWCRQCGAIKRTDSAEALRSGWPKCCGYTMTIDSPEDQKRLAEKAPDDQRGDMTTSGAHLGQNSGQLGAR